MIIRDPVHGDITLGPTERAILDLPEVQRLRRIKQLGMAALVYPGCTHTRFEHSLGTCHLSHRIMAQLRRTGVRIDADLEAAVGGAALLHDVTHIPFGHTLEDERCLFARHDKGARLSRLLAGGLGDRLRQLDAHAGVAGVLGAAPAATPPWAAQIVSSTIDADLLDYLRRDSYHAGVAQAYDDRVFSYFCVEGDQLAIAMTKHGMERADARSETVQLLRMRYFLSERIYYHHTKVAAGAMVSKAVELAQAYGALDEAELLTLGDAALLQRLRAVPTSARPDPAIVQLVEALERRRLLKRGYVLSARTVAAGERAALVGRFHADRPARMQVEDAVAHDLGCDRSQVILYCPALTVMKEAAAVARTPAGPRRLNEIDGSPFSEIRALEERYAHLWRLYVFVPEDRAARGAEAAAEVLGYPSEFRRRSPAGG